MVPMLGAALSTASSSFAQACAAVALLRDIQTEAGKRLACFGYL